LIETRRAVRCAVPIDEYWRRRPTAKAQIQPTSDCEFRGSRKQDDFSRTALRLREHFVNPLLTFVADLARLRRHFRHLT
jgi:hypothetical protein